MSNDKKNHIMFPGYGQGFETISSKVKTKISSSSNILQPADFGGNGFFHFEFDKITTEDYIEVEFMSSIVITGIVFDMPSKASVYEMSISVIEQCIQYPNEWTELKVYFCNI